MRGNLGRFAVGFVVALLASSLLTRATRWFLEQRSDVERRQGVELAVAVVATRPLPAGHRLEWKDITQRPLALPVMGTSLLSPEAAPAAIGRPLERALPEGAPLRNDSVARDERQRDPVLAGACDDALARERPIYETGHEAVRARVLGARR